MKRSIPLLLLLCLLVTGCGRKQADLTVYEYNGFTVDTQTQTITRGDDVYRYAFSGSEVTITYPNGAAYWWKYEQNGGVGGWSGDYDTDRYADGWDLLNALSYEPPRQSGGRNAPVGLLLIPVGLFLLISPRTVWYLSHGWRFKNAEPSDLALGLNRLGGGAARVRGVLLLLL